LTSPEQQSEDVSSTSLKVMAATGIAMLVVASVAVFLVSGHEGALSAFVVVGAGMVVVAALLPRLAGEFELGPRGLRARLTHQLQRTVQAAEARLPIAGEDEPETIAADREAVEEILAEAGSSPRAALLSLANRIENTVRDLLAQTGWMPTGGGLSFMPLVAYTEERGYFPASLTSSLRVFWDLRNSLIHGAEPVADEEVLRAIDLGVSILKMLGGIPHEVHVVYHPGAEVYADENGSIQREDVVALVLESTSPGGTRKERRVYPTTRRDYERGQVLSWEWNMARTWGESWYRDPDDRTVKYAWGGSAEFVGQPLRPRPS
jgi:hypothetical protein